VTGDVLLRAAGIEPGSTVAVSHSGLSDALTQLREGSVDALACSGGIPTPAIAEFDADYPLRMLPLDRFAGRMRGLSGYPYLPRNVPEVGYGPPAGGRTIGVPNLLLRRPGTSGPLVEAVVDVLVRDAARLVPSYVRGLQYLAPEAMIQTGAAPLHPAAIRAYRRHHG
jgi:TRAP-type uncharacterized transport system substrate-binding protein